MRRGAALIDPMSAVREKLDIECVRQLGNRRAHYVRYIAINIVLRWPTITFVQLALMHPRHLHGRR